MAQKVVVESDRITFYKECNELLSEGWKVIPGTVAVSTAVATSEKYNDKTEKVLVAFFTDEKD